MKIRIYQINLERDTDRVAFAGLSCLDRYQGSAEINSTIYDNIYEGEVACKTLEDVYRMFNLEHPADYTGRSLSVSDIVEIVEDGEIKPGFYFCDTIGFQQVDFQPSSEEAKNTIRVVLLEPGKLARIADIDSSLEGMQKVVGGFIEPVYAFEDADVCLVCNEEGKLNGMPLNRAIRAEATEVDMTYGEMVSKFRAAERAGGGKHITGYVLISEDSFDKPYSVKARTYAVSSDNKAFQPNMGGYSIFASAIDGSDPMVRLERYLAAEKGGSDGWKIERCYMKESSREILDIIAGPCFICDCSGENFGSLSPEQQARYKEKFLYPESFARIGGEIVSIPYKPKNKDHERER